MRPLEKRLSASLARLVQEHPLGEAGRAYLGARRLLDPASGQPSGGLVFGEATADLPKYAGRLLVPSFSARGSVVHVTFRCMESHGSSDCREAGHSKYLHWPGLEARLYGLGSLRTAGDTIHLCEGQLDAASLIAAGLPAVGIPGAQGWRPHHHRLFQGFDRVLFFADQDDKGAGMMLFENVRRSLPNVELVHLPTGHDVNSLLVAGGRDALMALLDAGDGAEGYDGCSDEDNTPDDDDEVIPF